MKLKKSEKLRLVLHKETLRTLGASDLRQAVGGLTTSFTTSCASACPGGWECYAE